MRISLPDDRIRIDGAVEVEVVDGGVRPHRLALAYAHGFPVETAFVEAMTSGVRLVFDTDATEITVGCTPMRLSLAGDMRPAMFELLVDDRRVSSAVADFGHVVEVDLADESTELTVGGPGDVVLVADADAVRTVTIWLAARRRRRNPLDLGSRRCGRASVAGRHPSPLGASRQLDLALHGSGGTVANLARDRRGPDGSSADQHRARRSVSRRPVRCADDPGAAGRSNQPEARHQRGQRRHDARDERSRRRSTDFSTRFVTGIRTRRSS